MAFLPINNFLIFNGELKPAVEFVTMENDGGIYEVLRVKQGVPLFVEEHLQRFFKSMKIAGKTVPFSEFEIIQFVKSLITANKIDVGNVLILCRESLEIFFIAHKYPTKKMVANGVKCGILYAERVNPNAKIMQASVRQKANELIFENNYYEVLLVDNLGRITEGSRSNLFFVKGSEIYTPPGNNVLLGVTRKKTIELAQKLGYSFFEENIELKHLPNFDAVFITGTSPKIMPLKQVGKYLFDPQNKIVGDLIKGYNRVVNEYVKQNLQK
jgi:branched-chain amino acid aminotransferase